MFDEFQLLGLKKSAIVLKTVADSLESAQAKKELLCLVQCIVDAANELETQIIIIKSAGKA